MKVLKEQVEHHVEEEEKELFPKVRKACSKEELEDLGARMEELVEELEARARRAATSRRRPTARPRSDARARVSGRGLAARCRAVRP